MEYKTLYSALWMKRFSAVLGSRNPLLLVPASAVLLFTIFFNISSAGTDFFDWDIVPYIGVVFTVTEDSTEAAHAKTYAEIKKGVSPSKYKFLIGEGTVRTDYLADVARDPESFSQQLPFYSVKPLYPLLIYLLNRLGINVVTASLLISQIAYLLIGGLLMYWLKQYYSIITACVLTMFLVSMPFVLTLATFSGPDALSAFIVLLAFFLFTETAYTKSAFVVLLMSITARPDNLILIGLLVVYDFIFHTERRPLAIGTLVAGLGIYFFQAGLSGNYGWKILFYHSFINLLSYPLSDPGSLTVSDYLNVLAERSRPADMVKTSYSLILFVVLNVIALQWQYKEPFTETRKFQVLLAGLLFSLVHWLIFPGQKERYLAVFFLFTIVSLVISARERVWPYSEASTKV